MFRALPWMLLATAVVGVLYLISFLQRKKSKGTSHTFVSLIAIGATLLLGVLILSLFFGRCGKRHRGKKMVTVYSEKPPLCEDPSGKCTPPPGWEAPSRIVIYRSLPKKLKKACPHAPVIIVDGTHVECRYGTEKLPKYLPKLKPKLQGWVFASVEPSEPSDRLVDRYAEVFYFLCLLLGVLSKFYWDWIEDRKEHPDLGFDPQKIILAIIVSAVVYLSVQAGLSTTDKLKVTACFWAFQNGFFFQTILQRRKEAKV